MDRDDLVKAIYDNNELWSCPKSGHCSAPSPRGCVECADELLSKYEKEVRADAIDEVYVMALNESHDTLIEWLQTQLEEQKDDRDN